MLTTLIGVIVVILGLICWVGQTMAVFFLPTAIKLGLFEPEHEVDPSMYLLERMSQGIMDVLLTWILPLSALLMILGQPSWPLFALVGGGVYLYFPGVFMITRLGALGCTDCHHVVIEILETTPCVDDAHFERWFRLDGYGLC